MSSDTNLAHLSALSNCRTRRSEHFFLIHMQTMSTATKHPLATGSGIIDYHQPSFDPPTSFYIQISNEYVGIFFSAPRAIPETELVIWEWKSGREKLVHKSCKHSLLQVSDILLSSIFLILGFYISLFCLGLMFSLLACQMTPLNLLYLISS